MATVDELKILIKAETRQLRKELDSVNRKLTQTGKSAERSSGAILGGFKKAGLAIAAFGLAAGKGVSSVRERVVHLKISRHLWIQSLVA